MPGNFIVEVEEAGEVYKHFKSKGMAFDFSHKVHRFEFGKQMDADYLRKQLFEDNDSTSKSLNPLDQKYTKQEAGEHKQMNMATSYFMDVTPTHYVNLAGRKTSNYQFSLSDQTTMSNSNPMINFRWELAPLAVVYRESRKESISFLVNLCAVIGGFITVASLLESLVRSILRDGRQEREPGKSL